MVSPASPVGEGGIPELLASPSSLLRPGSVSPQGHPPAAGDVYVATSAAVPPLVGGEEKSLGQDELILETPQADDTNYGPATPAAATAAVASPELDEEEIDLHPEKDEEFDGARKNRAGTEEEHRPISLSCVLGCKRISKIIFSNSSDHKISITVEQQDKLIPKSATVSVVKTKRVALTAEADLVGVGASVAAEREITNEQETEMMAKPYLLMTDHRLERSDKSSPTSVSFPNNCAELRVIAKYWHKEERAWIQYKDKVYRSGWIYRVNPSESTLRLFDPREN